jgi:hypothetical protein
MTYDESANSLFLFIILFIIFQSSFSFAQDGSQLIRIHTVADITSMNNTILPARGNLIYVQSEEQIYYYDGSSWQPISSNTSTSGWTLEGNSISSSQFVGTTNNEDFRIRSNDTLRMIVKSDGKVGVKNDNPTGAFQVTTNTTQSSSNTDLATPSNISWHDPGGGITGM